MSVSPIDRWKHGWDSVITVKSSGKKQRVKSIDEIAADIERKDKELRALKQGIEVDKTKPIEIVRNGDSFGFPKEHEFGDIQDELQRLHDEKFGIKRKKWEI